MRTFQESQRRIDYHMARMAYYGRMYKVIGTIIWTVVAIAALTVMAIEIYKAV